MENKFNNKTVVITGGTSGIGKAGAFCFAEAGANVVIAGRNETNGNQIVEEIKSKGGKAVFYRTDVTDYSQVINLSEFAVSMYGNLDVWWNNAGAGAPSGVLAGDVAGYGKVVENNQFSVAYGIFAAAKKMAEEKRGGVILNTSSVFGITAFPQNFAYGAAKAAVDNMTKTAALELAPYKIRVVGIAPGTVNTSIMGGEIENSPFGKQLKGCHMGNRILQPKEIGNIAVFLASDEASAINGTTIMADDGWTSFKYHMQEV